MRLQNQLACLLEETCIKLSSVVSDLLGVSARRILTAVANGESSPEALSDLADQRLRCSRTQLQDALNVPVSPVHRELLGMYLEQLALLDRQIEHLAVLAAQSMQPYQDAVLRLTGMPGIGITAAQQIIAETGPQALAFPTPGQFCSWMGSCPGRDESAGVNHSSRCPKGNRYLRRVLCQAAQSAVKAKGSRFEMLFRRLMPRLGYAKAIWAVVRHMGVVIWRILHEGVAYEERGEVLTPAAAKRRLHKLTQQIRKLGYTVEIKPAQPAASES